MLFQLRPCARGDLDGITDVELDKAESNVFPARGDQGAYPQPIKGDANHALREGRQVVQQR